jgi:hypothetical protein
MTIFGEAIALIIAVLIPLWILTYFKLWSLFWWLLGLYIFYGLLKNLIKNKEENESWFVYLKRLLNKTLNWVIKKFNNPD